MRKLDIAAGILMFIGAINWGFVGLFDFNLIDAFLENTWMDRLVYALIGVSGIYKVVYWRSIRSRWKEWREVED